MFQILRGTNVYRALRIALFESLARFSMCRISPAFLHYATTHALYTKTKYYKRETHEANKHIWAISPEIILVIGIRQPSSRAISAMRSRHQAKLMLNR